MKAEELYQFIEDEYGEDMVPSVRKDGRAYYWQKISTQPESSRIVRISANSAGDISELKLAVNNNVDAGAPLLALPASSNDIKNAVREQVNLYQKGR